ncbi:aldehyde dehydrogenase family protein, partial [Streptomyces sp. NPDC056105]|uniref:aldehyde dehydrogenase family protein n=1 Tax=Streptomyces sp. NPDC056105 TaxID=3345714 RepID=UPI0035D866A6
GGASLLLNPSIRPQTICNLYILRGWVLVVWASPPPQPRAAARLDFGTVWVNAHLVPAAEVPWGGFKRSGFKTSGFKRSGFKGSDYGRDLSVYALDDYSRTKHVKHNHAR